MKSGKVTPNAKSFEKPTTPGKQTPSKSDLKSKPSPVEKSAEKFDPIDLKTLK